MNNNSALFNEVFEEFDKAKTRDQRIAVLQKHGRNVWFKEFLNYVFNPKIKFDIMEIPSYRPSPQPAGLCFSTLSNEIRRLYIFIEGHPKRAAKLDAKKEQRILVALLESIHKGEAELLVKCFNKDLDVRYLTARLVKEAFPEIPFVVEDPKVELPIPKVNKIKATGTVNKAI